MLKRLYPVALLAPAALLAPVGLWAISHSALAANLPSSGTQMLQIPPTPPTSRKSDFKIEAAQGETAPIPESDGATIVVNRLIVTGLSVYPEAELLAIAGFTPGSNLSLSNLRVMAAKIADHYHRNGYFVAQVYLPAQEIKGGIVTVSVIEGHYGKIEVRNQTRLSNGLASGYMEGLNSGDPVTSAPLENRLLLLSDLPGVVVNSTLVPGAEPGTSDLIVDLTPGRTITGEIDADNAGNRYTGEYRVGASVNFNNLAGLGDVATLRAMTSFEGLNYFRGSYQAHFGKATAGVAYSHLEYTLGHEFESLDANGTADIASLYGSYPLIRSRNSNLYAGLGYDYKMYEDRMLGKATEKDAQVVSASLYGDHRDNFGGGGANGYSVTVSAGNLDIQSPKLRRLDAITAQTNGDFQKLNFAVSRLQDVTEDISFYAAFRGQLASKNLDVSEEMELGGMYAVRAYPEGEGYGDEGYVVNLEARLDLPTYYADLPGQAQAIGFVDVGGITVNNEPWGPGRNSRTLSGAGLGVDWTDPNNFAARAYYAHKLGDEKATSAPDEPGRFWMQVVKFF